MERNPEEHLVGLQEMSVRIREERLMELQETLERNPEEHLVGLQEMLEQILGERPRELVWLARVSAKWVRIL